MKAIFTKSIRTKLWISLGVLGVFLTVILSYAGVIGIKENSVQARIRDNQLHVTLGLSNESTRETNAKINFAITDIDGNILTTSSQSFTLLPVPNKKYSFVIPAKINSSKLVTYILKYTVITPDGNSVSGTKSLFEVVPQLETHIIGQREFYAGSKASMRIVVVNHATGEPVPDANVIINLSANNKIPSTLLFQGNTNENGTMDAQFTIPNDTTESNSELRIAVNSSIGNDLIKENIRLKRTYKILLTTDKPLYQPGQTIHIRSLTMRVPDLQPVKESPILLEVSDSKGNKIFKKEIKTGKFGIAAADFILADEINLGQYSIKASLGNNEMEKKVTVDKYVLPKFKMEIKTDKQYYAPGETVKGDIQSDYFFGKPVADGKVEIVASKFEIQFTEFSRLEGMLDKTGHYHFEMRLPDYFAGTPLEQGKAAVKLEVSVTDNADHKQNKTQMLSISKDPINIYAIPESGQLVPNLENIVYILTSYPDGSPAQCQVSGINPLLQTNSVGIAVYKLTPKNNSVKLNLSANDKQGNHVNKEITLSTETTTESIIIHTNKSLYQVGDALNLTAISSRKQGTVYVDFIKDGQTMLTKSVDLVNGKAILESTLDETLSGSLQIHAYMIAKSGDVLRDTRLIYVNPANELQISVKPDKSTYRPGNDAVIQFNVSDKSGHPVLTALGISIVDEAVFALQDMQPGLEKVYFTLEKEIMHPRYEIHGYELDHIVTNPEPLPAQQESAWSVRQQLAARVLLASAPQPPLPALKVNTFDTKQNQFKDELQKRIDKDYERITKAVQAFYNKHQKYPDKKDGIKQLVHEGFLRSFETQDPWGKPYEIIVPDWYQDMSYFSIRSYGPDQLLDTQDDLFAPELERNRWGFGGGIMAGDGGVRRGMLMDRLALPASAPMPQTAAKSDKIAWGGSIQGEGLWEFKDQKKPSDQEPPRLRMYFPETLYWNPALITDESGHATLRTKMADSITSWRLSALGSSMTGQMGSVTSPLRVFQDFFIDIDLPVVLTQNDQVSIPIAIYNYLPGAQNVRLEITPEPWFDLKDEKIKEINLAKDQVRSVYYTIQVKEIGFHKLTVTAYGEKMSDAIQRQIEVVPDGKETYVSFSDRLSKNISQIVTIPANAIANASKILVKIYPGIFSQIVEGLDAMLRMPFGCFEQTSSVTYPNILVLDYLKTTKQVTPEIQMKADGYINIGYQRLLSFEVKGGGFEWFGNAPANQILTSWGLMEFTDMSKVHEVDPNIITRTQQWLLNKQNADGSWTPDASFLHAESWSNIQSSKVLVTAYVLWGLSESGSKDAKLDKAFDYLQSHINDANDPYTQAIIANALVGGRSRPNLLNDIFDKLINSKIEKDGKVWWENKASTVTFSHGNGANVEATAMTSIAMMRAGKYSDTVTKILSYLISMKDANGNWGSTQATILSLKAMLMSLNSLTEKVNADITVFVNGKEAGKVKITPQDSDVMRLLDLKECTTTGDNKIELQFSGEGSMLYQIIGKYYVPWERQLPQNEPLTITVNYDKTQLTKDDIATATATVTNNRSAVANMVIIDLGIPPGFDVLTPDLDDLVANKTIQKYSMTGRQIIVYLDKIEKNQRFDLTYRLKAKFPIRAKTPSSQAYEYYNPEIKSTAKPVELIVK